MNQQTFLFNQNESETMKNWCLFIFLSLLSIFLGCELEETKYLKPIPQAAPASDVSTTSFIAHWHPMLGANKYRLDVSENKNFSPLLSSYSHKEIADTFAIVEGLKVNTIYYYRIICENNRSFSDASETIIAQTTIFNSPRALPAINVNEVSLTAVWKPVKGAESYSIDFSDNPAFDKRKMKTEQTYSTKDTLYVFSGLEVSKTYYYRIRSCSGSNISNFSKIISAQTTDLSKPIAKEASEITLTSFRANWDAVAGAEEYSIDVSDDATFSTVLDKYSGKKVKDLSQTISGLDADKEYFFRLRAVNNKSASEYSDVIVAKTAPLEAPIASEAMSQTHKSFIAKWSPSAHAQSYLVSVYSDPKLTVSVANAIDIEAFEASLQVADLQPSKNYYYIIKAKGLNAVSAPSNTIKVQTSSIPVPILKPSEDIHEFGFTCHWEGIEGVTQYLIELSENSSFTALLREKQIKGNTATFKNLAPDRTYYIRVRAQNGVASSAYSNTETTATEKITAPVATVPTAGSSFSFTANWNPVDIAKTYEIELATEPEFDNIIRQKEVKVNYLVFEGLQPGLDYFYRVKAKKDEFSSEFSNTVSTSTGSVAIPDARDASNIDLFEFTANWSIVDGASSYVIQIAKEETFGQILIQKSVDQTYFRATNLTPGTQYFYRVRSVMNNFPSNFSKFRSATTLNMEAPIATTATNIDLFSFTSNWSSVEGADSYVIQISKDNTFNTFDIQENVNQNYFQPTGLTPNTTYYYRVKTIKSGFSSDFSTPISTTTLNMGTPIAIEATNIGLFGFTANWSSIEGVNNYIIQISEDNTFNTFDIQESVNQNYFQTTGLTPNTTYYYRIKTIKDGFSSAFSNSISATTLNMETPIISEATNVDLFGFTANWSSIEGVDNFIIQVSKDKTFNTFDVQESVTQTYFQTTELSPNATYYYRVKAVKNGFSSDYSSVHSVNTVNIQAPTLNAASKISLFGFTTSWSTIANAEGYDFEVATDAAFATIVYKNTVKQAFLDLQNLQPSTKYFCRVRAIIGRFTSNYSVPIEVSTQELATPVSLAATAISNFSFRANWQTATNASEYEIEVSQTSNFDAIVTKQTTPETFFDFSNLKPGETYHYRVRSLHSGCVSPFSSAISVNTASIPAPIANAPTKTNSFGFTAEWSSVIGAAAYELELATDASFKNVISVKNVTNNYFDFTGLSPNTHYYFRVKTIQGLYTSASSNEVSVQTLDIEAPVALDATAVGILEFTANWQVVAEANRYSIELSSDANFTNVLSSANTTSTYHTFTGLNPSTDYYYRVRSEINGFVSSPSNVKNTKLLPLPAPIALEEDSKHAFGFTAKWATVADATSYSFDLATDPNFTQLVSNYSDKSLSDNFLVIDKLDYKTTYYYRVRAKRLNDYSDYSSTIVVEPAVANCQLVHIRDRYNREDYSINFSHYMNGIPTIFSINRSGTSNDFSFLVHLTNAKTTILKVEKFSDLNRQTLVEIWVPYFENGKIKSWSIQDENGIEKHSKLINYGKDGRIRHFIEYSDPSKTSYERKSYGYFNKKLRNIKKDGVLLFNYDLDEEVLNPINLIQAPELSIFLESARGAVQVLPATYCPGREYWIEGNPKAIGFYYEVNKLRLPKYANSSRTIEYKYNGFGCPIN